jgi:hypothetical protein
VKSRSVVRRVRLTAGLAFFFSSTASAEATSVPPMQKPSAFRVFEPVIFPASSNASTRHAM